MAGAWASEDGGARTPLELAGVDARATERRVRRVRANMAVIYPKNFTELAPFAPLFESGVPILTYHKIGSPRWRSRCRSICMPEKLLDRQMRELATAGYRTSLLSIDRWAGSNSARQVALTFDDAYESVFNKALPLLNELGFRATIFVVSGLIGGRNEWDVNEGEFPEKLMDEAQLREWLKEGHAIGSHTVRHPNLTRVPGAEAKEEIAASKKQLEDRFGVEVSDFCYPFGDWDRQVLEWVREAGYLTACTTEHGVNNDRTDRLLLRRIGARYPSRNLRWAWRKVRAMAAKVVRL